MNKLDELKAKYGKQDGVPQVKTIDMMLAEDQARVLTADFEEHQTELADWGCHLQYR